jgi:hypothetical protein
MIRALKMICTANFALSLLLYGGYVTYCVSKGIGVDHRWGIRPPVYDFHLLGYIGISDIAYGLLGSNDSGYLSGLGRSIGERFALGNVSKSIVTRKTETLT